MNAVDTCGICGGQYHRGHEEGCELNAFLAYKWRTDVPGVELTEPLADRARWYLRIKGHGRDCKGEPCNCGQDTLSGLLDASESISEVGGEGESGESSQPIPEISPAELANLPVVVATEEVLVTTDEPAPTHLWLAGYVYKNDPHPAFLLFAGESSDSAVLWARTRMLTYCAPSEILATNLPEQRDFPLLVTADEGTTRAWVRRVEVRS